MRVTERELDVLPLHLRAIADAHDLELAFEAVLDPVHHVGDERAHEAVERAHRAMVGAARDGDTLSARLTARLPGTAWLSLPLGPSARTVWPSTATLTPCGMGMGFLPIRDMAES